MLGYENAKDKANELRKKFNLKWDQVKFKSERSKSVGQMGKSRIDYARNYNPSKGRRFKGCSIQMGPTPIWTDHLCLEDGQSCSSDHLVGPYGKVSSSSAAVLIGKDLFQSSSVVVASAAVVGLCISQVQFCDIGPAVLFPELLASPTGACEQSCELP